jgi:glycosidase
MQRSTVFAIWLAIVAAGAGAGCGEPREEVAGSAAGRETASLSITAGTATVYYYLPYKGWSSANIHHNAGGSWTAVPGQVMAAACPGWATATLSFSAATFETVFNDGQNHWDNPLSGGNYVVPPGTSIVRNGAITTGAADPCRATPNSAAVLYRVPAGWTTVNIHYAPSGGPWTTPPGVPMAPACSGWVRKDIDLGAAGGLQVTFNNGSGTWDNNGGRNYSLGTGLSTVDAGVVTANAADPCRPDTSPPSVPGDVSASASGVTVTVTWTASTDDRGVTGYEITRTGGSQGTAVATSTTTSHQDAGLSPGTQYSYRVAALDAAGNRSASSATVSVTTGVLPPPPPPPAAGEPLGGDPRRDSIYFVLTARFHDGDPSNDRGGSQHVRSGNAARNDPMFRGDFSGLIQRLDYIKALGFSAVWITPVVLNRSDYDYHGYHGWDFYRVDPRLESPGATYGDLINAAHARGIKIIQDVVYNHSCRWGARGLHAAKVFGVRDSQWSWYYDAPVAGFEYDGLTIDPNTGKSYYNGDLWSTPEPPGNTCPGWGAPTQFTSPEGFRIYSCQWPSPTSRMFPASLFHQCWIGNWEGEDARSCWLHEDLADFNTENAAVQAHLIGAYNRFIDMGVDGFRIDTAVHVPRVTWNRRFLPAIQQHARERWGARGADFFVFGEVAAFVNDKWNRGSVNHSAQFFTWKERREYTADDVQAAIDQYNYEQGQGPANQPTSANAFLAGNSYRAPDHSQFSGMNIIDMRMHMNFSTAENAFWNGKDSDDSTNDATYNVVYVDSHDFGPNKSTTAYAGGTAAWAENMSLMWTFRGIPTLLQGAEVEFQAGRPIDCGPSCPLATTRRAYFGDRLAGQITAADFGVVASASGAVAETLASPLVRHVQRLNRIRRAIPALQRGQYSTADIGGNPTGMAFKRRFTDAASGTDSFALVTISGGATFSAIPNGTYRDAVTGDVRTVTNGTLTASLSGQGNLRVYVLDLPGNPAPGKIGEDGPFLR